VNDSRRAFIRGAAGVIGALASRLPAARAFARPRDKDALFHDDFRRKDRAGWGRPWFNQRYNRHWSVRSQRGIFRFPATENRMLYRPTPVLVLDHDVIDVDLRATMSVSNATLRAGLLARSVGYADYYAAYLAPSGHLRISRCGHHNETRLVGKRVPYQANRRYRLRMHVSGTGPVRLRAKVWAVGTREPAAWSLETVDAAPEALVARGAFGLFLQPPIDRRAAVARVSDVIARSPERGVTTAPAIGYQLTGVPLGTEARLVAMSAVPAEIGFEMAAEPTFTQDVLTIAPKHTNRALTARSNIDLSAFAQSDLVYWRPVARRDSMEVVGPVSSFRTGPEPGLPVRFAFGSCTRWQHSPRRSFDQARLKVADFYLHQGDFGYVPTKVTAHSSDTYQDHWIRMLMDPSFSAMAREMPVSLMRDDADYGRNRADAKTLRRFTIDAHNLLTANPGDYFETRYGDIAIFSIDCRRYSSGKEVAPEARSKLGPEQKEWLRRSMQQAAVDGMALLILSSPQAFGSDVNAEGWRAGYLDEWTELVDFFQSLRTPVLIVSGDAHGHRLHEYPQKNLQTDVPRIVEIVSSGTEQTKFFDEVDPQFLLRQAKGSGFGLVEVGAEQEMGGQRTRSLTLTAVKTSDGSPFWTASYLMVRGVGLVPVALP
jgi:hypothetical protein